MQSIIVYKQKFKFIEIFEWNFRPIDEILSASDQKKYLSQALTKQIWILYSTE